MGDEALRLGRTLKGHYGLVFGLGFACWIHSFRGELAEAESAGRRSSSSCPRSTDCRSGSPGALPEGPDPEQARRNYEAGLARMQKSVIGYRATGALIGLVHFMTEFAETSLAAGDFARGLATIEEARAICATHRQPLPRRRHSPRAGRAADRQQPRRGRRAQAAASRSTLRAAMGRRRAWSCRALTTLARRSPDWLMQLRATRSAITEGGDTVDLRPGERALLAASS